ncbi:uncharacterized protein LOC126367489 [Pectinophora gossypiella]|uniref:uncharacterized protein LOC126367489 n=1 Tax=Pectinophora gossypiella TaxID=13191 RepID=UPI00214F5EA0|nr:uncharacterized protein LOC126367489 [Pectinophora gossypiella]
MPLCTAFSLQLENIQHKMDENIDNNVAVLAMLDNQYGASAPAPHKSAMNMMEYSLQSHTQTINIPETDSTENNKQNIIWTKNATLMLLSFYETKMHMLDNPKKKSKLWASIAEELKALNIEVTPDQVRWKINALTKKYKDCVDNGQGSSSFKYYNEMHHILGRYSDDTGTYRLASGVMQNCDNRTKKSLNKTPFRKLRAERRAKIELDKQWIEYLKRQDEQKQIRDERYERSLRVKEEELQLRKKELELKQTLALKKLQLKERKQEELLKIEREKCSLLRKLLADQ